MFVRAARASFAVIGTVLAIATAGCGGSEVDLGTVSGIVTMDGKPLPQALVRFVPESGGRASSSVTDEEGKYNLLYTARVEGALVGPAKVTITTGDPEMSKQYPETVPARYNEETTLQVEVEPGHNEHNFALHSK